MSPTSHQSFRRSVLVGVLATAAFVAGCVPDGGPGTDPAPRLNLLRVLADSPLVPVSPSGGAQRAMSADFGRAAVMVPDPESFVSNIGVWDRSTGAITQLTQLDHQTFAVNPPTISADGSTIFFQHMYSSIDPTDPNSAESGVMRIDVASGDITPVPLGRVGVWDYSVSADGDKVLAKAGWNVTVSDDGVLTTLLAGTIDGAQYDVQRSSLSANGRFAAIPTATPVGSQTTEQGSLVVLDLELGTVHASWTGPTLTKVENTIASPYRINIRIASIGDDGTVFFTQGVGGPLRRLDGATGVTSSTSMSEAFAISGSSNGRRILVVGPAAGNHDELTYDAQSGDVADAHAEATAPYEWQSDGVADDGDLALLYGADPANGYDTGFYIWDRSA